MGGRNEGDDGGDDAFELDDNVAVAVDAFYGAFDASEVSFGDDDSATDFIGYVGVVEEGDAVVGDGGDTDEVFHLTVGYAKNVGTFLGIEGAAHHVAKGAEVFVGHFEPCELFTCGVDKEEVVDGRNEFKATVPAAFDQFVGDGQEVFDAQLVQACFHLQFSIVGDSHGVPVEGCSVFCHCCRCG